MAIRLIAVDMDGTCVDSRHRVPEKNIWALEQALRAGITVVPATGRPLNGYPTEIRSLAGIRYVISSNGARLTDMRTGRDLRRALIPDRAAAAFLRCLRGTGVWVSVHKDGVCIDKHAVPWIHRRLFYGRDFAGNQRIAGLERWLERQTGGVEKLQVFVLTPAARRRMEELLRKWPQLAAMPIHHRYVEITAAGATKGEALAALCERLGIGAAETMAIGDSHNDLSMLRFAGRAVAMGNANEHVKRTAGEVTASYDRCGVARAVIKALRE